MIEHQEIHKKDGTTVVFCRFEDLLMEAYHEADMDGVERHRNPNGEFICHCPFCAAEGHTKEKLYIKGDLTVGHCFVCTRAYVNIVDDIDLSYQVPPLYGEPNPGLQVVKLNDPEWTLDRYTYDFDDFDQKGYNYLLGRHPFMKDLYKLLEFKFLDGNVVMPFKYHGDLIYYQIRFTGKSKIRYYFPPIETGKKPPYIIEHGENKQFIICEGVYDAISLLIQAPDYTPMAVLGSCITDYQLMFLREYVPKKILVYMDDTQKSIAIARKIQSVIDYCRVSIIKSPGEDPEEMMKRRMKNGWSLQWIK